LWAAIFSGAGALAHSAPPFNIDSDELMTPQRARHFLTLHNFLSGMPELSPAEVSADRGASAWALKAAKGDVAAVWLLAPEASYATPMRDVRVRLPGIENGRWRVEWIDDVTGRRLASSSEVAAGGQMTVTAPPFTAHVAARLRRLPSP
jgi:hypothetical protein